MLAILGGIQLALLTGCETSLNRTTPITPGTPPDIEVIIKDRSTSQPISGASITLYKKYLSGVVKKGTRTTAADGIALFEEVEPGEYLVYARATGYLVGFAGWVATDVSASGQGTIFLSTISSLPDLNTDIATGEQQDIDTEEMSDDLPDTVLVMPVSSVTLDQGSVPSGTEVSIASIPSSQADIPIDKTAYGTISISGATGASGTISIGTGISLPAGTEVPIYKYDETTGTWVNTGEKGVVDSEGNIVATLDDISGILSALASFVPARQKLSEWLVDSQHYETLAAEDITHPWTPELTFLSDTYPRKTRDWIRMTLEKEMGFTYGDPTLSEVRKPAGQTGDAEVWGRIDRYTINVTGRVARGAATTYRADSHSESLIWNDLSHTSGTGGE